jgi:Xaa-Pro aminopeptidase
LFEWPHIDWDGFTARRRTLFHGLMESEGIDHAILSGFDGIRWATGIRTNYTHDSNYDWFCAVVDPANEVTLITNDGGTDEEHPEPGLPWLRRRVSGPSWQSHWAHPTPFAREIAGALIRGKARRVGVDALSFEVMDRLRAQLPEVEFVPLMRPFLDLRRIKMPEEIALTEAACEVASLAMSAGINGARDGMRDSDIVSLAVDAVYGCGAEQLSHAVIVCQSSPGETGWFASGRRIRRGQSFFMDLGCYGVGGYCSDFCRVGFIGEPPKEVRRAYRDLLDVHDTVAAELRPGALCSEITSRINAGLEAKGLPPTPYAMGHGIGARLVEPPSIYTPSLMERDDRIEEGMIICIEPSTHVEANGVAVGLKDENQYLVERDGLRNLTLCGRVID